LTKTAPIAARERQMLELLAQGASSRTIGKKVGLTEGTVRVYLHNLYKKIGVRNRTEALLWQLEHARGVAHLRPAAAPANSTIRADDTFGDVALREGLLQTLGIMESFIGPYGRVWEVAARLKGGAPDERVAGLRDDVRMLWRSLLHGAFAHAKEMHDDGRAERLVEEAPGEAVLLVMLLLIGGYSNAAGQHLAQLTRGRKGARPVGARDVSLMQALRDAVEGSNGAALGTLHQIASEKGASPVLKQLATVALFHVYRLRKDNATACEVANTIWAEAEEAREQLEAMGIRPLAREAPLPKMAKAAARARENVSGG
jgi:DNA-binding CsgD family transcriptional regulator